MSHRPDGLAGQLKGKGFRRVSKISQYIAVNIIRTDSTFPGSCCNTFGFRYWSHGSLSPEAESS